MCIHLEVRHAFCHRAGVAQPIGRHLATSGRRAELVITSNGRPVAILSAVSPAGLEESLAAFDAPAPWRRSGPCKRNRWPPETPNHQDAIEAEILRFARIATNEIVLGTNVLVSGLLIRTARPARLSEWQRWAKFVVF